MNNSTDNSQTYNDCERNNSSCNTKFVGYSGPARAVSGLLALVAALLFNFGILPDSVEMAEYAWGGVVLGMLIINYGALAVRYFSLPHRSLSCVKPAIDALPGMFAALIGTLALAHGGMHDYIFGFWLLIYGAANAAHRKHYGDTIWTLGMFYILCGTLSMLVFRPDFNNPWLIGASLAVGEVWGGVIFYMRNSKTLHASAVAN